ncbi:hypothetical protein BGZ74_002410, partial [Mortierella antarctica]
ATILLDHLPQPSVYNDLEVCMCLGCELVTATAALSIPLYACSSMNLLTRFYGDSKLRDIFFVFNTANPHTDSVDCGDSAKQIGAHKLVLRQWPYFRWMLESEFVEGGPGDQRIQIRDVKPTTFRVLVWLMYAGEIPQGVMPARVCAAVEGQAGADQTSFEEVFLAAHRYELQELCAWVQKTIDTNVNSTDAIPFLFCVGYLFDELRVPMVK